MTSRTIGLHKFLKDSVLTFSQQFLSLVLGFATSIILARSLGRSGVGILTLTFLFSTLTITFVRFGVPAATTYLLGSHKYDLPEALSNAISISFFQSLLGVLAAATILLFFKDQVLKNVDIRYLYWMLIVIPINLTNANLRAIFQALQDFKSFNITALFQLAWVTLLLVALLLFQAISIQNVIFINIAASLLTLILIVYLLHRHIPLSKLRLGVHPAYLRDSLQYGAKVYTSSIFTFFNYKQDRFLLNSYLSPASVGVYNIGANLGERLWLVSQSISTVLFPKIASLRGDEKQRRWMTPFITRHIFTGTAIAAVFLYWSSPFLIQLLYGSEFAAASDVLRIILPGVVFLTISRIVANDIAGRGRPGINTILAGVALVINLIANLLLISRFGIRGAAWASTISYTANAILKTIIYSHIAGVSWFSLFIIRFSDLQVWKHLIVESRRHAQPTI